MLDMDVTVDFVVKRVRAALRDTICDIRFNSLINTDGYCKKNFSNKLPN